MKLYYKKGVYLSFFKFSLNLEGPRRYAQNEKPCKFSQDFGGMVENRVVLRRSSDFFVFRKALYYKIAKNVRNLVNLVQNRNFKVIQNGNKMP